MNNPNPKLLSRATANDLGLVRYFDGDTCKNGHVAERYTKSGHCVECIAEGYERWVAGSGAAARDFRREEEMSRRPEEPKRSEKHTHSPRTPNAAREKDPRLATKQIDPTTPVVLEMWADGVPTDQIAAKVGKTARAVQLVAAYHKARRPDWYIKVVRGRTQQVAA
jgi:hypothetical protein